MSRTAVIVSDAEDSRALCRLCMIYHEYFVNIFISNDDFRICAEETIHDLLSLKVAVGDGLPSNICHQCVNKLIEFRDFKEMCLKTSAELRKYYLDNVLRSRAKEELGSSENAQVVKEEVNGEEHRIEGDVPVNALTSVAVDPLAVNTMAFKEEAQESKGTVGNGNCLSDISPHSHIQVTEVFVPVPDQLSLGNASHVVEDWRLAELMFHEEIGEGLDCNENGVPVVSLSSVNVDPLAVDTTALKEEAQEPNGDVGEGNSLGDTGPYNHIRVTEVFVPVPDQLAMGIVRYAEKDPRQTELIFMEETGEGLECSENDVPVGSLSSVYVDPLVVDTKVDRCYNIGGLKMEPEEESDKIGADRKWISQKKVHINPSCDPVREENLQPEHSMAKSFVVNCFPQESVNNHKKNVKFYNSNEKFSQLNYRAKPVGNYEREQLCHQDENTSYPTEYICNYCGTRYLEKNSLALHIKRHVDEMRSASVLPETDFPPRFSQRLLVKDRGHVEPVILETGNVSFTQITCGSVKALKCNECGKMFSTKSTLNKHSVVHTGVKAFKCNECGKMFTRKNDLKMHSVVHTDVKPFKCKECGKMFTRKTNLKMHLVVHTDVKPFKCKECGKMFSQISHLKRHSVSHTGMKPFMCNKCGKMFSTKSDLIRHSVVHTGVKSFKCNECGKAFTRKSDLNEHYVVHSGVKRFECKECGKMFTRKCTLNKHSVVHTGVKDFQCNECGMMFTGKDELNMHSVIHHGAKRFKCNECGKLFTRKDTLILHWRVHSGVKAFKCSECGKMFTQRSHLRSHSRIHSGVKLYKCDVCSKQFKWKSVLNTHLLAHADQNRSK